MAALLELQELSLSSVGIELLSFACWLIRGYYSNRRLKSEGQDLLRRELDIRLLACGLNAAARSCASDGTNRSPFSTAKDSAENGTGDCAAADFLRRILAARTGLL